ncbi:MAG TPA: PhoPQ-activated protein PqaA family protein [Candidatus Hydrogenedentes bacterium]|nr:PhoPQ-activated protein PqaA family protein [Candidatus Hydrogenedentota bacterium]HQH53263.1 PhoPQ-activated protein PqaA family protein [Candidatus Hydrogenedentota bacterium]HQM47852.1 PhoPQ-activated protein PqaA family protein [Candidatus Hydrogenedentota bacterium]
MRHSRASFLVLLFTCLVAGLAAAGPLADFVNVPDPNYQYEITGTYDGDRYTAHFIRMTSQSWREGEVSPNLWTHWLSVYIPDDLQQSEVLLRIQGGKNTDGQPGPEHEWATIAVVTRSITAVLRTVPSQPLVFTGEDKGRVEDEIIALTFKYFSETKDPTWPLLLPMVKSVVRAMDTIQNFAATKLDTPAAVDAFVLTGASKRGWTTWLTGATDPRVKAIAPQVIDVLNMKPQMEYQKFSYGDYSQEIEDYSELDLMSLLTGPEGKPLLEVVDPYEYRDALTMPKLVMLGSGDQYWTVDAAKFYYPDLRGEKHLYYEPNADHGMGKKEDAVKTLTAFYNEVITDSPRPEFTWRLRDNGRYAVKPEEPPAAAYLWKADAPTRDFRLMTVGDVWKSAPIEADARGWYRGKVERPDKGFTAYYIELEYPSPLGFNYGFTTIMKLLEPKD